jgi:SAM-dependent methyltransferase
MEDKYEGSFNSKNFLNAFYDPNLEIDTDPNNQLRSIYDNLNTAFDLQFIQGDWLLDIGTGPCIYSTLFESRKFKNIVLSDYTSSNRAELLKWTNNEKDAHCWHNSIAYIAKLENLDHQTIINRTKSSIRSIIPIDINKPKLIEPIWFKNFDCIVSCFCLEVVSPNHDSLRDITFKSIKELLKPNGFLIIFGVLNEKYYIVGEIKYELYGFELSDIISALEANHFKIVHNKITNNVLNLYPPLPADAQNYYLIVAQSTI